MKLGKVSPLVIIAISTLLLSSGFAMAGTTTTQLLQNPSFDNGGNDWQTYEYSKNEYNQVITPELSITFSNSEVDMYSKTNIHLSYSIAMITQYLTLPSYINASNITSASLSVRYSATLNNANKVSLVYRVFLKSNSQVGVQTRIYFPDGTHTISWTTNSTNITSFVKQNLGQEVAVQAFLDVSGYGGLNANSHLYIDYIYLKITYKTASSGNSGGSSGWWGNGGSWWGGGGFWHGNGGVWFAGNSSGNATYVEYVAGNIQRLLAIVGGAVIGVLWVKEALDFFSDDPERKARARENALKASVATIIIALAVFGAIWFIAIWVVGGG